MDAKKLHMCVKLALMREESSEAKIAPRIGMTQQGLNRKLRVGTLRAGELIDLMEALGYRITATKGDDTIGF